MIILDVKRSDEEDFKPWRLNDTWMDDYDFDQQIIKLLYAAGRLAHMSGDTLRIEIEFVKEE